MQTLTKTIKTLFITSLLLLVFSCPVFAAVNPNPISLPGSSPPASSLPPYGTHPCHPELDQASDGSSQAGQPLSASDLASCQACTKNNPSAAQLNNCLKKNPIIGDLKTVVSFLSAGVGVVIVGSIVTGGVQYTMAGNNPNAVSAAKQRITNSVIALVTFFFIFGFLNWLIPGGILFGF